MLYAGPYSQTFQIWRKKPDAWGNPGGNKKPPIPALYGFTFSHWIEEAATISPRTTETVKASGEMEKRNYTGMTLYCDVHEDIQSDDLVVWEDARGRLQVAEVEGEGYNDYISPYSGMQAGKEVFLGRVVHRR